MAYSPTCLADHPNHIRRIATLQPWEVHIGYVQLFIVGPGEHAWLAASKSLYHGQVGTDAERAIAHRAIQILRRHQGENQEVGPEQIAAALELATRQLTTEALD